MLTLKQQLKSIITAPRKLKTSLHRQFPAVFGLEVKDTVVQLYRFDSEIDTVLSFNHFIEYFSQKSLIDVHLEIEAWDRFGKSLGKKLEKIEKKGVWQKSLSLVFSNLDSFGMFSVKMSLKPHFVPELNYLGTVSPQFMTMFIPKSAAGAPQMIHSHKTRQGYLFMRRIQTRKSSHREFLGMSESLTFFIPNSCASTLNFQLQIVDGDEKVIEKDNCQIPGYGVALISLSCKELQEKTKSNVVRFNYLYDLPVDHKKPVIFRYFASGTWACNHT